MCREGVLGTVLSLTCQEEPAVSLLLVLLCLEGAQWPALRVMLMQGRGRQIEGIGPVRALFSCQINQQPVLSLKPTLLLEL